MIDVASKIADIEFLLREAGQRRVEKKIDRYVPHFKQALFHKNPAQFRMLLGSNRSGKTKSLIAEAISYCLGSRLWDGTKTRRAPSKVLIAGQDFVHAIAGSVCPTIEEMLPQGSLREDQPTVKIHSGITSQYNFANGSILSLMSYVQDEASVEGYDWDFIGFNEPPPRWFYVGCVRGIMDRGGRVVFAMTPISEPWIYDEIYSKCGIDPKYWAIHVALDDNPHIPQEEKETFIASLTPEEVEARIHGKFKHLMGRVFPEFRYDVHVVPVEFEEVSDEKTKQEV